MFSEPLQTMSDKCTGSIWHCYILWTKWVRINFFTLLFHRKDNIKLLFQWKTVFILTSPSIYAIFFPLNPWFTFKIQITKFWFDHWTEMLIWTLMLNHDLNIIECAGSSVLKLFAPYGLHKKVLLYFRDFLEVFSMLEGVSHTVSLPIVIHDIHQLDTNQWILTEARTNK